MEWTKVFFVRILLFFIAGILAGKSCMHVPLPVGFLISVPIIILSILGGINQVKIRTRQYRLKSLENIFIGLFIFSFGFCSFQLNFPGKNLNHFSHKKFEHIKVILSESLKPASNSQKGELKVLAGRTQESWEYTEGNILAYFPDNINLPAGTSLLISRPPVEAKPPLNPYQFDYSEYLINRGITHTIFLKEDDYIIIDFPLWYYPGSIAENIKKSIQKTLGQYIHEAKHRAIVSGLLLGDKSEMSEELNKKFSISGLSHILAVSGFHTALIYQLLTWLLGFLRKLKNGNLVFTVSVLLSLWLYAFLSGLPPSVIRAALMLSLFLIGKLINRKQNGLHVLSLTAFIILLYNPFYLFDLGFQLSFSAVLGIILTYKPLSKLIKSDSIVLKKAWEIICISISAQLLTFPIVAFYFHNLPVYFIISNLLSTLPVIILVYSTLLLLVISWTGPVAVILGKFISRVCEILEFIVSTISELPGLDGEVYFSPVMLAGLLIIILCTYGAILNRNVKLFFVSCSVLVIICFSAIKQINHKANQEIISVFHIPGHSAVAVIKGFSASIYTDIENPEKSRKIQYAIKGFLGHHFVDSIRYFHLNNNLEINVFGKNILISNSLNKEYQADYLLMHRPNYQEKYLEAEGFHKIIFDGSNKYYKDNHVNLNAHFTAKSGAFIKYLTP